MFRHIKTIYKEELHEWTIDDLFDATPVVLLSHVEDKEILVKELDLTCILHKYPDYIIIDVGNKKFKLEIDPIKLFNTTTAHLYLNNLLDFKETVVRYINTTSNIIVKTYKATFLEEVEDMFSILLNDCIVTVGCVENCNN